MTWQRSLTATTREGYNVDKTLLLKFLDSNGVRPGLAQEVSTLEIDPQLQQVFEDLMAYQANAPSVEKLQDTIAELTSALDDIVDISMDDDGSIAMRDICELARAR